MSRSFNVYNLCVIANTFMRLTVLNKNINSVTGDSIGIITGEKNPTIKKTITPYHYIPNRQIKNFVRLFNGKSTTSGHSSIPRKHLQLLVLDL